MAPSLKAPRYLSQFRCLGEACPDTCCAGFTVLLDSSDLARVDSAIGSSRSLRARRQQAIHPEDDGEGAVASLKQGEACSFLDADRLCSLIKRRGQAGVPDACALYPRTLSYLADHVELRATAGCPEIARSLVTDPDALVVGEVPADAAARIPEPGPRPPPTAYSQRRDQVLRLGERVLDAPGPVRQRLAVLGRFSAAVEETFHRGSPGVDPQAWSAASKRFLGRSAGAPATRWLGQASESDRTLGAQILFSLLMNLRDGGSRRFTRLLDASLATYHQALPTGSDEALFSALASVFQQRDRELQAKVGPSLEGALRRHLQNEWRRVWFTQSRSLSAHLFGLSLELAAVRILLNAHPAALALPAKRPSPEQEADFTQALIDTLQIVSRRLGSTHGLLETLEEQLSPQALGTDDAGRLRLLLTYC
ncbi:MAG: flagellin lysine-N-methylase [Myxococcota bacterium]|nr:flagellin lysine-N-methylase [Myxococcota bacterium]